MKTQVYASGFRLRVVGLEVRVERDSCWFLLCRGLNRVLGAYSPGGPSGQTAWKDLWVLVWNQARKPRPQMIEFLVNQELGDMPGSEDPLHGHTQCS